MFKNLTKQEKEEKFAQLLEYADKINNKKLNKVCVNILNDYKSEILCRCAGHDGVENISAGIRTHQNFNGGLIDHVLNVVIHSYNIALVYKKAKDSLYFVS